MTDNEAKAHKAQIKLTAIQRAFSDAEESAVAAEDLARRSKLRFKKAKRAWKQADKAARKVRKVAERTAKQVEKATAKAERLAKERAAINGSSTAPGKTRLSVVRSRRKSTAKSASATGRAIATPRRPRAAKPKARPPVPEPVPQADALED